MANLSEYPAYYADMGVINREGPPEVEGSTTADLKRWSRSAAIDSYRVADFEALAGVGDRDGLRVVDVRREDEFRSAHISGAVNIPVHTLLDDTFERAVDLRLTGLPG